MSNTEQEQVSPKGYPQAPFNKDAPINWYAFVIDGEVVWMQTCQVSLEFLNIVLKSDPKIVPVPEALAGEVLSGWTYDGFEFHAPAE
jgi:hypothetical protein